MLLGEYNYAVDSKGRLNFPAKFREKMGQMFIVTKWLDNCLVAFPQEEWERMDALLEEKGMLKPRQVKRFLYAYACEESRTNKAASFCLRLFAPTLASQRMSQ